MLFAQITQPLGKPFIIVPSVSSEKRKYVPIGFMDGNTIASNLVFVIPDATLYHFGILTSCVHNAWMRAVCGRLKSDYRYSKDIVYNNFPWPDSPSKIESSCQWQVDPVARSDGGVCQNQNATHSTALKGTSPNLGEEG